MKKNILCAFLVFIPMLLKDHHKNIVLAEKIKNKKETFSSQESIILDTKKNIGIKKYNFPTSTVDNQPQKFNKEKKNLNFTEYVKYIGEYVEPIEEKKFIVLRKLKEENDTSYQYLAVNPLDLKIRLIKSEKVKAKKWAYLEEQYKSTPYIKLRQKSKDMNLSDFYNNRGIKSFNGKGKVIITTDLCPTLKSLNYSLYEDIYLRMLGNRGQSVPIGVAVSGKWIKTHRKDIQWLKKMEKDKKLSITWINHSYNHIYKKGVAIKNNFMLTKNTNLDKEILNLERLLLKENLEISIYFRFPGLVSNKNLFEQILDYGLIPLGSDSWIAKNQFPKNGSIVLVHGNGNEHLGVEKLRKWMTSQKNIFEATSLNKQFIENFKND